MRFLRLDCLAHQSLVLHILVSARHCIIKEIPTAHPVHYVHKGGAFRKPLHYLVSKSWYSCEASQTSLEASMNSSIPPCFQLVAIYASSKNYQGHQLPCLLCSTYSLSIDLKFSHSAPSRYIPQPSHSSRIFIRSSRSASLFDEASLRWASLGHVPIGGCVTGYRSRVRPASQSVCYRAASSNLNKNSDFAGVVSPGLQCRAAGGTRCERGVDVMRKDEKGNETSTTESTTR